MIDILHRKLETENLFILYLFTWNKQFSLICSETYFNNKNPVSVILYHLHYPASIGIVVNGSN